MLRGVKLIKNLPDGTELTTDCFIADVGYSRRRSGHESSADRGKLQITVNGEARASGKIGDRIAVKNSQSNAVIQAIVVDEGLVKIIF